jgi:hypothetical protein
LLLDFSVLELVDVHLSLLRVWVDRGAVEEVLRQGRVGLLGRAALGLHVRLHGTGYVRLAAGLFQRCLGWRGGVASASQALAASECVPGYLPSMWFQHGFPC